MMRVFPCGKWLGADDNDESVGTGHTLYPATLIADNEKEATEDFHIVLMVGAHCAIRLFYEHDCCVHTA